MAPVVGEYCWWVRCVEDHVLRIDFGQPHLRITEPREIPADATPFLTASLSRRLVFPVGEWHLFVLDGLWSVETQYYRCARNDQDMVNIGRCLNSLQGQKLVSSAFDEQEQAWKFRFDLGGLLSIREDKAEDDGHQWVLFFENDDSLSWDRGGVLTFETKSA